MPIRTIHWASFAGSGMHHVAASMVRAELAIGVEARLLDPLDAAQTGWELALEADVQVNHTHQPDTVGGKSLKRSCTKPMKTVFFHHGPVVRQVFDVEADCAAAKLKPSGGPAEHPAEQFDAERLTRIGQR